MIITIRFQLIAVLSPPFDRTLTRIQAEWKPVGRPECALTFDSTARSPARRGRWRFGPE
jgi:hypothetical protein